MNRLYILLTVMVVMLTAPLFGAHEALAEDFLGTAFNDPLFVTEGDDYLKGRAGDDYLDAAGGNDMIYGNKPATTLTGAQSDDVGDSTRDLIDCAYLESRGNSGPDVGYGGDRNTDVVVDCSNRDDQ